MEYDIDENDEFFKIDIKDPDSMRFGFNDVVFNHPGVVLEAYRRVLSALAQEMTEGFWQQKLDKQGNSIWTWMTDTRNAAIESIETLKNAMIGDLQGTKFEKDINKLNADIDSEYEKAKNESDLDWRNTHIGPGQKLAYIKAHGVPRTFNDKSPAWHSFIEVKLKAYRKIFEQLELCIKDLKYFRKERNRA